jgi:aerobic-type carbon monoxide dehydrogenase small subunit (CoxS/CutS family)
VTPAGPGPAGNGEVTIMLDVNREPRRLCVRSDARLLDVLRDQLGLHSVRDACSVGMCGACTVAVDGVALSSCLTLAALCDGSRVTTAEGLMADGEPDAVVIAWARARAFQCSYCTPGYVVAISALLSSNPSPTYQELVTWLSGHLCRCGSYARILATAEAAVAELRPAPGQT